MKKTSEEKNESVQTSFKERNVEVQETRKQTLKEKGFDPLWNAPEGESRITVIVDAGIRTVNTKNGVRDVVKIKIGRETFDWMINPATGYYATILNLVTSGKTKLKVVRTGQKLQTRYSILEA